MSYSTNPVADASAYYEPRYTAAEAQAKAEWEADRAFTAACAAGDANAIATFAPMVRDFTAPVSPVGAYVPKRVQLLTEVMQESLDYPSGPSMTEAMQLLLNVAYGTDPVAVQDQAKRLIERMATTWASQNTVVDA
jgi:hypothetical protein